MQFPNKCARCGFCCISQACILAQIAFGIEEKDPCPALSSEGDRAVCSLPGVPFGDGCCILARVYRNGVEYNYADLPDEVKIGFVKTLRNWKDEKRKGQDIGGMPHQTDENLQVGLHR